MGALFMITLRKSITETTIEVQLVPNVMDVVSEAIYDGIFMTSNSNVSEARFEEMGFTQEALSKYLRQLVAIRWQLVTQQITAQNRAKAKQLYVPAGVAQMLTMIGEVEVGNYSIKLRALTDEEIGKVDWKEVEEFSFLLLRMREFVCSAKYILMPKQEGDVSVMSMIIDRCDTRDAEISVHANADETQLHPVKQAFALMAGIKLVNEDRFGIVYPSNLFVDDYRANLVDAFKNKVDQ